MRDLSIQFKLVQLIEINKYIESIILPLMRNIQKKQYSLNFLTQLINSPQFKPFLYFDDLLFGFFDFQFTAKHIEKNDLSLIALYNEASNRKNFNYQWMCGELRKIFIKISDYLLSNDQLQITCKLGMIMIADFQNQYLNEFKRKKIVVDNQKPQSQPTLKDHIQMIFYLKSYEHDEETIKKIGEVCQIIHQTEEEYVLDLDQNTLWEAMIGRNCYQ